MRYSALWHGLTQPVQTTVRDAMRHACLVLEGVLADAYIRSSLGCSLRQVECRA